MSSARLLSRVILSHLVVAVPPAVVLGVLVAEINREALYGEIQQVNLAVADQVAVRLSTRVEAVSRALGQAERILDMSELPLDRRMTLLQAVVADGEVPFLGIYSAAGKKDSWIGPSAGAAEQLEPGLLARAKDGAVTLGTPALSEGRAAAPVVLLWRVDGEPWGYLVTEVDLGAMSPLCTSLAELHLGPGGALVVADGQRRVVASSTPGAVGQLLGEGSALAALSGDWSSALGAVALRTSLTYTTAAGEARLASLVSDPERGWIVAASRPQAVALASLDRVRTRVVVLALLAAVAAGLAGLLLARQVSAPVRTLTLAVREAWARGFSTPIVAPSGPGEVQELATAFNGALDELKRHRQEARLHSNIKVRLARFLSPTAIHQILTGEWTAREAATERVTVLYADLAGASELVGGQLETGHLVQVLGDFFACATAAVEAHGGRLDRYSGDVVIAVFRTGERADHADAAVAAGTKILRDTASLSARWAPLVGLELSASLGLTTGQAPVESATTAAGSEVTVAGELVDRAARQQLAARPGTLILDAETRRALASTPLAVVRPAPAMPDCFELDPRAEPSVTTQRVHP